jgi:2-polyprenyl-3-methyl-5-hydroxy-6-metoxy-1,4-benzoquinol methylase
VSSNLERLWNANIHYHPVVLASIPREARRVLDVGCGDGILSAALARAGVRHVVGLDLDAGVLARAKARHLDGSIEWLQGDVFSVPFDRRPSTRSSPSRRGITSTRRP